MKTAVLTAFVLVSALLLSGAAPALKGWRSLLPTVSGDLAITKERAERGDVKAQLELADKLTANQLVAQGVTWYRKAAEHGSVEAKFRLGDILINGALSTPDPDQRVSPNPVEGVRWTFEAATNFNAGACRNMAYVTENGIGGGTNIVEAYAWMEVYARSNLSTARADMDRMALRMSLEEIRQAHTTAQQFQSRQWPHRVTRKFSDADLALKLSGITLGPVSLAMINGRTFELGDSAALPIKDGMARISCVKISQDSVLIAVEGESEPRVLRLR